MTYGGEPIQRSKVTVRTLREMKERGQKIVSTTAYDFPSAVIADQAGIDLILVGDSVGMVVLGYDSTIPVTMAEMSHHVRAVARARPRALLVADLPFNSFQASAEDAVRNSGRFLKRGAEAVKLEGGRRMLSQIEAIVHADIPVLGHLVSRRNRSTSSAATGCRREAARPPTRSWKTRSSWRRPAASRLS